ncbi:MAG: SlyX family protein [Alistipes senegalensis]|nr:SlyX family protein [Oxalobacter formigenes]MCM1281979.1 SlyX family protein [Alistipes senegalensis]
MSKKGRGLGMEERLMDLEMRISHQEEAIDVLNRTVYRQQNQIDQLEAALSELARRMVEKAHDRMDPAHEKPPHY